MLDFCPGTDGTELCVIGNGLPQAFALGRTPPDPPVRRFQGLSPPATLARDGNSVLAPNGTKMFI